jgi:diguanylate cyclase (GGDEF)-like protein
MILRSLQTRIVVFFVLLLCALQVAGLALMNAANERIAKDQIAHELLVGERVFRRLVDQNSQQLSQAASVLAADFAFRSAIATRDEGTIASALNNHGRRINASVVMLAGLDKGMLADTLHSSTKQTTFPFPELIDAAQKNGRASDIVLIDAHPYQIVVVPVLAPIPIAWVAMGFIINDAVALDLHDLSGLQVSFLSRVGLDDWKVNASTLPLSTRGELSYGLVADGTSVALSIAGESYETLRSIIHRRGDVTIAAVLQRRLKEGLEPFNRLRDTLFALGLASIVLSIIGSVLIARGIARPIKGLADVARKVRDGDYSHKAEAGRADEIGDFASSFNHMLEGISERELKITRLAYEDTLTGLPNRAMFVDRLERAIQVSHRSKEPVIVLMLDLDRFKAINDSLGYAVGDEVLRDVAKRLRESLQDTEVLARFGGDVFAVLVSAGGVSRAQSVVALIEKALASPIVTKGQPIDLGVSMGMAVFPGHASDAASLIRHADIAMYVAKRTDAGFTAYEPEFDQDKSSQLSLLGELRTAVELDQLTLYYQPKVDLRSGASDSVEALVRWIHPQRGFIPPADFIPFAEQTGYIKIVTRWVLEHALKQSGEWHQRGIDVKLSVNLSARDLTNPDLISTIVELTKRYGIPPPLLCLEITESAVMEDTVRAQETLERLHNLGFRLSLDDFGTGHSSLVYIRRLPVKEMKIDRSFVRNMVTDKDDAVIVRSTIELGHNMGLRVVAEGVEDHASLMMLTKLGCDEAQGYFIAKPLPPDQYEAWLRNRRQLGEKLTESGFISDRRG